MYTWFIFYSQIFPQTENLEFFETSSLIPIPLDLKSYPNTLKILIQCFADI